VQSFKLLHHCYVFMQSYSKPLHCRWTQNTGIFLIMQANSHIQILKQSTEQLHSTLFWHE
jgi:hypothetical protein